MAQNPHRSRSGGRRAASKTDTVPVGAKILAQHGPSSGLSAKKLSQHAQKRQMWGVLSAQGELFRAFAMTQCRRANFFVPNDTASASSFTGTHEDRAAKVTAVSSRRSDALDTAPMHQIALHCTGN